MNICNLKRHLIYLFVFFKEFKLLIKLVPVFLIEHGFLHVFVPAKRIKLLHQCNNELLSSFFCLIK